MHPNGSSDWCSWTPTTVPSRGSMRTRWRSASRSSAPAGSPHCWTCSPSLPASPRGPVRRAAARRAPRLLRVRRRQDPELLGGHVRGHGPRAHHPHGSTRPPGGPAVAGPGRGRRGGRGLPAEPVAAWPTPSVPPTWSCPRRRALPAVREPRRLVGRRRPPSWRRRATGRLTRPQGCASSQAGEVGDGLEGGHGAVVVGVLGFPGDVVRDVHGMAAELEHGEHIALHRVADHGELARARRPSTR